MEYSHPVHYWLFRVLFLQAEYNVQLHGVKERDENAPNGSYRPTIKGLVKDQFFEGSFFKKDC